MQKDVHNISIFFLPLLVNETDCNCTAFWSARLRLQSAVQWQ